jgi:mercuric ion transport protein
MVRSFARRALPVVAAIFVACGLVQVFLAGLGVFDDPASFVTHREFGYLLGWFTLAMLVLALLGRQRRLIVGLTILVLVQFTFQSVFVALRTTYPAVAALHPVNGFLLLVVGIAIARLSWVARHEAADARAVGPAPGADPRPVAVEGG